MKKLLLAGLALFGVVVLTGCDQIMSLVSGEKEYKYDDFKALLADRNLSFTVTKCASIIDKDGEKTARNYTYDAEDSSWNYTYTTTILGAETETTGSKTLDVIAYTKTVELTAALLDKKVEEVFKFYATGDAYRITGEYKNSSVRAEVEYKFGKDGLMKSSYEKETDLDSIKSTITKETFTYSE